VETVAWRNLQIFETCSKINVFIERLWKSVKYEDIYLKAYGSMAEVKKGLASYFMFYNEKRWHQNFDRKTPAMVYFSTQPQKQAAA
jgi:putative transposase